MATKALVIDAGTTRRVPDAETLIVGVGIDAATATTLTVGGTTANAITIGKVGITTTFPGPVQLNGTVTSVAQTTFTTDAVFQGNVTFGDAASDNISFVGQVDTAITQEGIAAPAVSPASTGRIYFDSSTNTFKVSQNGGAYVDLITAGAVTGSGAATRVAFWSSATNLTSDADMTYDSTANALTVGTVLGVRRTGPGDTGFALAGNGDPDTGIVFDQWEIAANTLSIYANGSRSAYFSETRLVSGALGGANLFMGIGTPVTPQFTGTGDIATGFFIQTVAGVSASGVARQTWSDTESVVNSPGLDYDFRVAGDTNTYALFVQGSDSHVGIGTSSVGAHLFNVGSGASSNFAVASGGRIHTYDGTAPTNGQVLIGDGGAGNFAKSTLTAGSGVTITNGAGTITIAATGSGGTVTSVDVSGGTTGLTTSGGPITGSGTITLAGTLNAANGGTGLTAPGTAGNVLTSNGTTWQSTALPAATDYSVITLTTSATAGTPIKNDGTAAQATSAANARVVGIASATNTAKVLGIVNCLIETSITISAGDVVYLSANESGKVTNVAPSTATQVVAELGIARANGSGAGGNVNIVWQPKSITVL